MRRALIAVTLALVLPLAGSTGRVHTPPSTDTLAPFKPNSPAEHRWHNLYRQAYALHQSGKFQQAAELFEQSVELARTARCEVCELRSLSNLAGDRLAASQHREALDAFLQARRLAVRTGNREIAGILSLNLSNLYIHRFALQEAVAAAEEAMTALSRSTQPWLRTKALIHKARLLARQGDMDRASRLFAQVVGEASRTGDVTSEAMAWEHLGLQHLRRSELRQAEDALIEAFRLRRTSNDAVLAASYDDLAMLRIEQGDAGSALRLADRALAEWRGASSVRPLWQLRLTRGRALAGVGRAPDAIAELDRALDQIRAQRVEALPADALRISYGAGTQDVYAARIEVGNRLALSGAAPRLVDEGFALAEEARSLSLRHATGEWESVHRRLSPEYYEALSRLQTVQGDLQTADSPDRRREMESVRLRLIEMEAAAGLTDARDSAGPVRDVRWSELGADQALFSFYLGNKESYRWAATRDGVELQRLPARAELAARIEAFARSIQEGGTLAAGQGEQLCRILFGNVSGKVSARRQWLLSLDGELFDLPFAALVVEHRDGKPVYLAQRHAIQLIPGAWALHNRAAAEWSGPMLALGDPVYNVADRRWTDAARVHVREGSELPRLPGSAREARACLRAWGGDGLLLEGLDAGWEEFRAEVQRRRPEAVHLATHYVESLERPRQVLLALGLSRRGHWQYVGPEQIASLRLASRLVVMSGCGSGNGRSLAGEGRIGLARAWLKSGARTVAATYWPTPDESGALVEAFYRHWRNPKLANSLSRPAEALRMAQLEMIQAGSWKAEPRYWASYFLIGKS